MIKLYYIIDCVVDTTHALGPVCVTDLMCCVERGALLFYRDLEAKYCNNVKLDLSPLLLFFLLSSLQGLATRRIFKDIFLLSLGQYPFNVKKKKKERKKKEKRLWKNLFAISIRNKNIDR